MTRRSSIVANLLSAALCLAAIAFGAWAMMRPLSWAYDWRGSRVEFGGGAGRLGPAVSLGYARSRYERAEGGASAGALGAGRGNPKVDQSAFALVEFTRVSGTLHDRRTLRWVEVRSWGVRLPVIYLALATGFLPAVTLVQWYRGVKPPRAGPDGNCARCGYDMINIAGTCPRCGVSVVRVGFFGIF
jgi:hypothetical protein